MNEKELTNIIEKTQKMVEQNIGFLSDHYNKQVNTISANRNLLDQFYKLTKEYEHIQFYLTEATPTPPTIFNISVRYMGQEVATVSLTNDNKILITTEDYNKSNKEIFNCDTELKQEEWNSINTQKFLNYFEGDIKPKGKLNTKSQLESMLLAEFSKTTSYDKLLTGIQPTKIRKKPILPYTSYSK